jgi:hypothetical protein
MRLSQICEIVLKTRIPKIHVGSVKKHVKIELPTAFSTVPTENIHSKNSRKFTSALSNFTSEWSSASTLA